MLLPACGRQAGAGAPAAGASAFGWHGTPAPRPARTSPSVCVPPLPSLHEAASAAAPAQFHPAFALAGHASWDDLQQELDTMPPQGTRVRCAWGRW